MNKEEVLKLANLARIRIADREAEALSHEFEAILGYVGEVKEAHKLKNREAKKEDFAVRNVMREDVSPHQSGAYTEKLLEASPKREGDYIKVKQILG